MTELLSSCEAHLRAGQPRLAARLLSEVNTARVPRAHRLPLATLSRRSGLGALGLRLLSPIVRVDKNLATDARPDELAEYAVLLHRCGATTEALEILMRLNPDEAPDVRLFRSFCYFGLWDYESAITELKSHVDSGLAPYPRLVAKVNLAAALIGTNRFDEALVILVQVASVAEVQKFDRIMSNCQELQAQALLLSGKTDDAENLLCHASKVFGTQATLERLYIRKWQALIASMKTGSIEPLTIFRNEALQWPHPETVRDTDLRILSLSFNEASFEHLYFGSPWQAYRAKIEVLLKRRPATRSYRFGSAQGPSIELATGEFLGSTKKTIGFVRGSQIHQTLDVLLRDFYRPTPVGVIFSHLFPGERFDIFTSPNRCHQALGRLRSWVEEADFPMLVERQASGYKIAIVGDASIIIPLERRPRTLDAIQLEKLLSTFGHDVTFTGQQARALLNISPSAFVRLAEFAISSRRLERYGSGPSTCYFFAVKQDRNAA